MGVIGQSPMATSKKNPIAEVQSPKLSKYKRPDTGSYSYILNRTSDHKEQFGPRHIFCRHSY